MGTNLKYFYVK